MRSKFQVDPLAYALEPCTQARRKTTATVKEKFSAQGKTDAPPQLNMQTSLSALGNFSVTGQTLSPAIHTHAVKGCALVAVLRRMKI